MKSIERQRNSDLYSCQYCLYWNGREYGCVYPSGCCCPVPQNPPVRFGRTASDSSKKKTGSIAESDCKGCPYGKDFPCFGWCTQSTSGKSSQKRKRTVLIIIGILLIIAILLLLLRGCNGSSVPANSDEPVKNSLVYDNSAVKGGWDEADLDGIIAGLNEKVEAGMINISMNTSPFFSDGTSEGNLMIVNETTNNYPQIVVITRNDTGEEIYRSGGIPVGSKIETAKLAVDLPAGTYECTAMFHSVDSATGVSLGCAGAIISVTVLE